MNIRLLVFLMDDSMNVITKIIDKYRVHLFIFGIALILLLGCTIPKIYINDEWITTNQLAQIDQGHQVITSEGKYGTYENGTPGNYFISHNNGLGYTLFLPLISLPALKCINFFGDTFLFFLIEFWTLLLIVVVLFVREFFPEYVGKSKYNWTNITIIVAFIMFLGNLVFYQPFILTGNTAHQEVAAIALTNILLLSALAVILYSIYSTMFQSSRISLSATIISICCSSYIFWTTNAKDHMLMAFLFGVLIYCGIKYIYTHDRWYIPALFITIGWIAWGRAETAVPLFVAFIILVIPKCIMTCWIDKNLKSGAFFFFSPLFTLIGALPLFTNNFFISGNPLISTWVAFSSRSVQATSANLTVSQNIQTGSTYLLHMASSQYSLSIQNSIFDLLGILFLPKTSSIAILALCPVIIIGLALAILYKIYWRNLELTEKKSILFLAAISVLIFIAYIRALDGMTISFGITPDMRYLSPVYLPFGIIGVMLIKKCGILPRFSKEGFTVFVIVFSEIVTILITFILLFKPVDNNFQFFVSTISETISCIVYALIILCILVFFLFRNENHRKEYCNLILHAVIVVPLVWQLSIIFISSCGINYDGYTYWLPVVKTALQQFQDFIVLS
jgi:hypothetical protein